MAKAGRGQTRRDSKRRVLRPGESIRADGKYQYKYHIDGKPHFVYSWKLEPTDKLPKGKKPCLSLRELEKQVNTDSRCNHQAASIFKCHRKKSKMQSPGCNHPQVPQKEKQDTIAY